MVLFLNLDSSKPPPHNSSRGLPTAKPQQNPNITHPFTALLSSYPLLISLAKHLDLGDLATLSSTCHPFRSLLLPQRENLTSTSLVCKNSGQQQPRRCVKDLVNECRGCLKPVCRNCARRPSSWVQSLRLRRLCSNHRMCSLQEFGKVCECTEIWLCAGCLGVYPSLGPVIVTANKLFDEERGCSFWKRGGYVGQCGDGDSGTGSGCTMGVEEISEFPLKLEKAGVFRGWCDWCNGVVLTAEDRAALEKGE